MIIAIILCKQSCNIQVVSSRKTRDPVDKSNKNLYNMSKYVTFWKPLPIGVMTIERGGKPVGAVRNSLLTFSGNCAKLTWNKKQWRRQARLLHLSERGPSGERALLFELPRTTFELPGGNAGTAAPVTAPMSGGIFCAATRVEPWNTLIVSHPWF